MSKLSYEDIINYLIRLIDKHGYDILRTSKNRFLLKKKRKELKKKIYA